MKTIKLIRTDSANQDFIDLVELLDADLAVRDGEDHSFYNQFNSINQIRYALVCLENNKPVGCGAIKEYSSLAMEVKRMFILPDYRGRGFATLILAELENWALELGFKKCILETGKMQPEAIELYAKNGYCKTPNYGQYTDVDNSLCFEKNLK